MVSVMIPTTFNGLLHLAGLMPLLSQEKDTELIIVDNASRDGTCNYLANYDCTIKINKTNLGFSKANNQAAKIAQGDYLLLLNNDTTIIPGFIGEMVNTFECDPKIGVVGCLIFTMDNPKKVQHAGIMFTNNYVPYELGLEIPDVAPGIVANDDRVRSVRPVPSVTAACMMVKREVWDKVGGLDEEYVNGWEDTDFVLKARELGYKVWYTGKTHIYHKHFGSYGRFKMEAENRQRYDNIWVNTGRAKNALQGFRKG